MKIENYIELFKNEFFKEAAQAERICLFLGAGVAQNLEMPDWNGLASNVINFCLANRVISHSYVKTLGSLNDPLKIISVCIERIEKKGKVLEFNKQLKKIFIEAPNDSYDNKKNDKRKIYKALIDICKNNKALIVQTNYDSIIENGCNDNGRGYVKNCIKAYVPYVDDKDTDLNGCLVYLHGKIIETQNPIYENLILTKKQYNDIYVLERQEGSNNTYFEKQKGFFRSLLENYFVIFLGYSLQDIEIVQLIANKPVREGYKQIAVIVDTCKAKQLSNEIDAQYLKQASNEKVKTYSYSTENKGFEAFKNVILKLHKELNNYPIQSDITLFQNPDNVIFPDEVIP